MLPNLLRGKLMIKQAGNRVQRVRTEVSSAQMAQAIISAWQQKFGSAPSKEQVAMILAQNDLETGHRKSMWNYNVGNITTKGDGTFDYFDDLTTNEQTSPGNWKKMKLKYRAYPDLEDGVKDYLNLLSTGRYTKAWQHILNPDPASFSKALKDAGYYTADEAPYTKNLVSLFDRNSKSNNYELAMSGKVNPPKNNTSDSDNMFSNYIKRVKNDMSIYDQLGSNKGSAPSQPLAVTNPTLNNLIENYLQRVTASEKLNRKIYEKYLPINRAVIKIAAIDYVDSIEFARVLCSVLDEELVARAFTHTDGKRVEVECSIPGPSQDCFEALEQITLATAVAFKKATIKIGGVAIKTKLVTNKKSHRDQLDIKAAEAQYRKFLLKFI
jgi:flagellum-specific peptidoglycan hydrolase FlgJ